MPLFTSSKEKRQWLYVVLVVLAIFLSLTFGKPIQNLIVDQNIQAIFFVAAMVLIAIAIVVHGLKVQASNIELTSWFGFLAILILLIFRLGASERSHLIEYSILALFIHQALKTRMKKNKNWQTPAFIAFCITAGIGVIDEVIQLLIPNRVFDFQDMLFNSLAALFAISVSLVLDRLKEKYRKN